jgi:hypothetical protein
MSNSREKCVGFIQLQFIDEKLNQIVSLGGAGFETQEELDAFWASIPTFQGHTTFMADLLDAERDIVDDKPISAEACEALMKKPISVLIEEGRAELMAYLAHLHTNIMR